ncbi:Uncharacterised protein [Klebsiella michiganensis]|uniref:Uncharacterized protein n=1 Tax=Klebsiella michiganensis TaxID=1134687 RepID=A0A7H4N6N9_9ENTR|nr:Uncharacterised protein [Klebsiella michiganensis]
MKISKIPQTLARMNPVKADMLTFMVAHMKQVKSYKRCFEGYVKFDYIQELVSDLQEQCYEWSGNSNNINDWYDEDLYDAVTSSEQPFSKFVESIDGIKSLAKGDFKDKQKEHLLSILYINVITALETLYVELFINSIDKNDSYLTDFIEKGKTEFKVNKEILAFAIQRRNY